MVFEISGDRCYIMEILKMEDKMNKNIKVILGILLALLIAAGGFLAGKNSAADEYAKKKEIDNLIKSSSVDGLGVIEGTIYVTGHKAPDCDTVSSSVAFANLLKELGSDAKAVVAGPVDEGTRFIYEDAGLELPELLENAAGLNIMLMDHSDYLQTIDGMTDANILGIIDHHGVGSVTTAKPIIYDARPIGAATTIIWTYYRDLEVEIDPQIARIMVGAILSDTSNFSSGSTTEADRLAVEQLSAIAGIKDLNAYYQEIYKRSISYSGMTDEEIFFSDYKAYEANGRKYGIGCVNAYDEEPAADLVRRMKDLYSTNINANGAEMLFSQISIFHDGISIVYLVPNSAEAAAVIEKAFKDDATYKPAFDGTAYRFEPGFSRKAVLVPAINAALEAE